MRIIWSLRTSGLLALTGRGAMFPGRVVAVGVRDAAWSASGDGRVAPEKGPLALANIGTDLKIMKLGTVEYSLYFNTFCRAFHAQSNLG